MNQKIMLTLLFLLVVPIASALSIEELTASYDYTYSDNFEVRSITYGPGRDTNFDGRTDTLFVTLDVTSPAGTYVGMGDLYRNGKFYTSISENWILSEGDTEVRLEFDSKILEDGNYKLALTVQENFLTIYQDLDALDITFTRGFEYDVKPFDVSYLSHDTVDLNGNGVDDTLQVIMNIFAEDSGDAQLNLVIGDETWTFNRFNHTLKWRNNQVEFNFSGEVLKDLMIDNARIKRLEIERDETNYAYTFDIPLSYDLSSLESGKNTFTGEVIVNAFGEDKKDLLVFDLGIDIVDGGTWIYGGDLYTVYGEYVASHRVSGGVSEGRGFTRIEFQGSDIYKSGLNGPYVLQSAYMEFADQRDTIVDVVITEEYAYTDFTAGAQADLLVRDVTRTKAVVENIGDAYGFNVKVDVLDENFNSYSTSVIDMLPPGTSREVSFEGRDNIFVFADFENSIDESDESNNIGSYGYEMVLGQGWNLVSLPIEPATFNVGTLFSLFESAWVYDSRWMFYKTVFDNSFVIFDKTQGIWLNMEQDATLIIDGSAYSYPITFSLTEGRNLISYPATAGVSISSAFEDVSELQSVSSYDEYWRTYVTGRPDELNSLRSLHPGKGYWVTVSSDVTLEFDGKRFS